MSGFEIAGLTLAAFKLLCEAGKQVAHTSQHFKTWWRFEREFEKFLWTIEREQIAFSQNLEILLAPLEGDLSAHERQILQSGLHSDLWHMPHIQKALRQGVQESYYEWFVKQLVDINDALTQLHQLLPIVESSPDNKMLETHIYRLRHSFFPRKDELLALIAKKNESTYLFFSRASLRPARPHRPDTRKAKSCLELQRQALTLHETLHTCWSCSCDGTDQHQMAITTWKPAAARHSAPDTHHIRILSSNIPIQLRVEVEAITKSEEVMPRTPSTKQTEITTLRRELTLRTKLKELKDKSSKGISLVATSTISLAARPGLGAIPKENNPRSGRISALRQRLRRKKESRPDSAESQTNITPQLNYELPPIPHVRFADEHHPTSVTTTGTTGFKGDITKITKLCQILKSPSSGESCQGFLPMTRTLPSVEASRVVFHLDPAVTIVTYHTTT